MTHKYSKTHQFFPSCECDQAWYQFYILQAKERAGEVRWNIQTITKNGSALEHIQKSLTLMTPGQFGPTSRVLSCRSSLCLTRTMSCWGIPSVMHTTNGISASIASLIAAAANGGGTYITVAEAPVCSLAYNGRNKKRYRVFSGGEENIWPLVI